MGLFRHLGLKLLSFALAVLLWSLVAGQKVSPSLLSPAARSEA